MNYEFHRFADIFPLIEGDDFAALVADVRANGIHQQIDIYQGKILDGRNRYRAAEAAGIELVARDFRYFRPELHGDPLDYVMSQNLRRRHLNESQRAMAGARLATMRQGERVDLAAARQSSTHASPIVEDTGDATRNLETSGFVKPGPRPANLPVISQPAAAKTLSISERALRAARRVQENGVPELGRAVDRGRLAVSVAEKAARMAPDIQRKIAAEAEEGRPEVARSMVKQEHRVERERDLAERQRALPDKRYCLIYCDIPRHFNVRSDQTGLDRSPENHYPTMSFDETLALPVPTIAADDCILIFWSTAASLLDDIEIMAEWGFVSFRPRDGLGKLSRPNGVALPPAGAGTYKSMQVWDKVRMGLGYWFRDRHEFILVGVRGNVVPPAPGTQDESLFSEPKGVHSAKPGRVADMIDRLWPNIPKIELFARQARPGWDVWGLEAPTEPPPAVESPGPAVEEPAADTPSVVLPPANPSNDDEQLDIPPFLRRQAS